ncbi:MAG: tRNA (adenosine(37)-N6)-dimethylallyltransferase MiaA [Parachlamydiaceae bacterium]|nr:tRNA (adenosine(37)-N6)-dimethylallyltransferase MiaA [Parachlamydiaceae bacterium]
MCLAEKEKIGRIFQGVAQEAKQHLGELQKPKKRVILLAGPTAVGKSAIGIALAQAMGGEIVSADSMQVYRGMDIGSSKPSLEDQKLVNHHLVDIRQVNEIFNVVDFYYEARHSCQIIHARENVSVVVGGSGFYLHSFIYGPPNGPPSVPELREKLEAEIELFGAEFLYKRVVELDAKYAATITKNDKQKIVRALEIMTLTGEKVSSMAWSSRRHPQNYDFRCWFLNRPRESLYHRIEKRCMKMLEEGFIDEVKALIEVGIKTNSSAAQAIGYRQAIEFLESKQTEADYARFISHFKQASRNYAKRQLTWFRREPMFRWLDLDMHDPEIVVDMIRQDFENGLT